MKKHQLKNVLYLNAVNTIKFSLLVGLCAIFIDATIAEGLLWENDPYWTYWFTTNFLITTIFSIGTALGGIGMVPGLILALIHTFILGTYYQWLSPVGLPEEPRWLDFNHLWTSGFISHFLAILSGYYLALWIWKRKGASHNRYSSSTPSAVKYTRASVCHSSAIKFVLSVLSIVVIAVILDIIMGHMFLIGQFPGITYIIQHILSGFISVGVWSLWVGFHDIKGWVVGSGIMALGWSWYNIYLAPIGLPSHDPTYLGYTDLWMKIFPVDWMAFIVAVPLVGLVVSYMCQRRVYSLIIACILGGSCMHAREGLFASAFASGEGIIITGDNPPDLKKFETIYGTISVKVINNGNRWSHVQNTGVIHGVAEFEASGSHYKITINKTMPHHPLGWYTIWNGVAYRQDMQGPTGRRAKSLQKIKPDIALWGWAQIERDGKLLSKMAPAHIMVINQGREAGIMLKIATEDKSLLGIPDGYLNLRWPTITSFSFPENEIKQREMIGWVALLGLTILCGVLAVTQKSKNRNY